MATSDRLWRVFRPIVAEGFEWIQPVRERDLHLLYDLDGTSRAAKWRPVSVRGLTRDDLGRPLLRADMPWLGGHAIVLDDRAREAVGAILGEAGEFLPLDPVDRDGGLWLFNACRIVDALDEASSELVRFPSSGRVMAVKRHVFRGGAVAGLAAFRVPQSRSLFLSGAVVDAIGRAELRGAAFDLAWRGE